MSEDPNVIISGGGIAGLLLAISLKKLNLNCQVYEQAPAYAEGVGGAIGTFQAYIGLYPNGLRIIRDISLELLYEIRSLGRPFTLRKWMRHDGSTIAVGQEKYLVNFESEKDMIELSSMGIRRWKLQKALYLFCKRKGIPIHLGKRINNINLRGSIVECILSDGSKTAGNLLFGCDGVNSVIRGCLFGKESIPTYTGITCLMGSAPIAKQSQINGICFPSSTTTKAHACYYPCSDEEIIFQIYTPCEERPETWKALTPFEAKLECESLLKTLVNDGWGRIFTDPVKEADSVLRVGLRAREPIPIWHFPQKDTRIMLLGDAAHPPVPYIGQGAMMAIEDVGILSLLIKNFCKPQPNFPFDYSMLDKVAEKYENLRIPRTTEMLRASQSLGDMQLSRSNTSFEDMRRKELEIQKNVDKYGTLPVMFKGPGYNYSKEVEKILDGAKFYPKL